MSAFDLDRFAPPPISFTLRERVYTVNGDVDVDVVARMLRVESAISEAEGIDETVAAVREGRELLLEMIQEREPDVAELKIGAQALLVTFALILHGSSVAAAVAEAISQPTQTDPVTGEPVQTARDGTDEGGPGEETAPLASARSSSERSSSSGGQESGLLVTGTA